MPMPAPSPPPTAMPSQVPSQTPTFVPTAVPTNAPTQSPSSGPTVGPTQIPTPVPSIDCGDEALIYRLMLFDQGGDGWQGTTFTIYPSTSGSAMFESEPIQSGTLPDGFEDTAWLCLLDGCYEIVVGGGVAPSEVGFAFRDEHGGHFQDLTAPFSDHFCVEHGDVFEHPTASPTVSQYPSLVPFPAPSVSPAPSPIPARYPPSPVPTSFPSNIPTPTPTIVPTPVPSTPAPTRTPVVALSASMSGVSGGCSGYGQREQRIVNQALAAQIQGNPSFSNHSCEDVAESSRRLDDAGAISVSMEISISAASVTDDGNQDVLGAVSSAVSAAQSSGALQSSITTFAGAENITSLASMVVGGISVDTFTPTQAPSPVPLPAPTAVPIPMPTSVAPTGAPSPAPTAAPTPAPTAAPTARPSGPRPTSQPSPAPSISQQPTPFPSYAPTTPTALPTQSPTEAPTPPPTPPPTIPKKDKDDDTSSGLTLGGTIGIGFGVFAICFGTGFAAMQFGSHREKQQGDGAPERNPRKSFLARHQHQEEKANGEENQRIAAKTVKLNDWFDEIALHAAMGDDEDLPTSDVDVNCFLAALTHDEWSEA